MPNRKIDNSIMRESTIISTGQPGIQGFVCQNINKTCHMLNGNRKNPGYIIAAWNCGRGLM